MSEGNGEFRYLINGKEGQTDDRTPESAKLLSDAGFEPADDYLLIERTQHGSRVVTSDDVLDIASGTSEFFAFESGEALEFTVNEHSVFWGKEKISAAEVRHLARVAPDFDLVWMRDGAENVILADDSFLDLRKSGIEHVRSHKRPVEPVFYIYFVGPTEYRTELERITGAQVTAKIANWNPANSLVLESEGAAPDEVIHPNTIVELKGRPHPARFTIVPPATFGSR